MALNVLSINALQVLLDALGDWGVCVMASFYILLEAKDSAISFFTHCRKAILQTIDASTCMGINKGNGNRLLLKVLNQVN